jgi:hypothetical protein
MLSHRSCTGYVRGECGQATLLMLGVLAVLLAGVLVLLTMRADI